jgi:hypothetical protein
MRCRDLRVRVVAARVTIPEVVGQEHHDVGRARFFCAVSLTLGERSNACEHTGQHPCREPVSSMGSLLVHRMRLLGEGPREFFPTCAPSRLPRSRGINTRHNACARRVGRSYPSYRFSNRYSNSQTNVRTYQDVCRCTTGWLAGTLLRDAPP